MSNLLLLNRRSQNVEPQLFASELEKFRPYQSRLAAAVNASKQIVTELEGIVARVEKGQGVRRHARSDKERAKRLRDWERNLEKAGAQHAEVVAGLSKGLGYYESLDRVVSDIAREVKNFVHQRDAERSRLVSELETRQRISGAGAASSPSPASRDIGSQLAGLSLNAPSSAPGAPPKPASPYAPPKPSSPAANPYDFSALSSLSGAPSSFQTGSPAPAPPPPNRSTSGGYPSFPSVPSGAPSSSPSAPYPPPPKPQGSYAPPPPQHQHSSAYPVPPQQPQGTGSS